MQSTDAIEHVLCVPKKYVETQYTMNAVSPWNTLYRAALLEEIASHGVWKQRTAIEQDTRFYQVITYTIFQNTQSCDFFRYQRDYDTGQDGEQRLHSKTSIGVGGHINPHDIFNINQRYAIKGDVHSWMPVLGNAVNRELTEELNSSYLFEYTTYHARWLGVLQCNHTPVDKVHIGLVNIVDLEPKHCKTLQRPGNVCDWQSLDNLCRDNNLENWSKIVVDYLVDQWDKRKR
jgi:predicted NUDIX family phosphoesterase